MHRQRKNDLEEHITKDLKLQKELEDELRREHLTFAKIGTVEGRWTQGQYSSKRNYYEN